MNIERRLRAIEAAMNMVAEPVTLYFADGSTSELHGRPGFVVSLLGRVFDNAGPATQEAFQLDLIRRSVASKEACGAHMIDLIRALLNGAEEATDTSAASIRRPE
jgi:hypothetical protein